VRIRRGRSGEMRYQVSYQTDVDESVYRCVVKVMIKQVNEELSRSEDDLLPCECQLELRLSMIELG